MVKFLINSRISILRKLNVFKYFLKKIKQFFFSFYELNKVLDENFVFKKLFQKITHNFVQLNKCYNNFDIFEQFLLHKKSINQNFKKKKNVIQAHFLEKKKKCLLWLLEFKFYQLVRSTFPLANTNLVDFVFELFDLSAEVLLISEIKNFFSR